MDPFLGIYKNDVYERNSTVLENEDHLLLRHPYRDQQATPLWPTAECFLFNPAFSAKGVDVCERAGYRYSARYLPTDGVFGDDDDGGEGTGGVG